MGSKLGIPRGPYKLRPRSERFWSHVDQSGNCWEWTGCRDKSGYGHLTLSGYYHTGKAHRVAYELTYGEIPQGQIVLHRCDNPPCVRPDHLFLGTQLDNIRDMKRKGREAKRAGNSQNMAKLDEDWVRRIRSMADGTRSLRSIARELGFVSSTTVIDVVNRKTWRHVDD